MTNRTKRLMLKGLCAAVAAMIGACQAGAVGVACDDAWCPDGMRCVLLSTAGSMTCVIPGRCGNHIVEPESGEICDPPEPGACSDDCKSRLVCGNHIVDPGEQCDDGNRDNGDGCSSTCQFELCGNGMLDPHEECDGLLGLQPCNQQICRFEFCGDGITNREEQCDPLDPEFGPRKCNPDCTLSICGDGKINSFADEECERASIGQSAIGQPCNAVTCKLEVCGNAIVDDDDSTDVHEQCDDGNRQSGDGCSSTCQIEFCGDGKTNNHETCDPTDPSWGPKRCNTDCTPSFCGDGKLNPFNGEQCDGPLGPQPCNAATCRLEMCGNGIVDNDETTGVHEQCDDGNRKPGDGCSEICQFECGNGVLDPHEQCDGSLGLKPCNSTTCLQERCGNGILDNDTVTGVHEQCDDGNTVDGDGCSATCQLEHCGNDVLDLFEQCDGTHGLQPCNATTCLQEICGNGVIDNDDAHNIHEQCDDGNTEDGDGCSSTCQNERTATSSESSRIPGNASEQSRR